MKKKYFIAILFFIVSILGNAQELKTAIVYNDTSFVEHTVEWLSPEAYRTRYQEKDLLFKVTDNFGNGFDPLYGTRNLRSVIHGIAYRGGGNNFYHKTKKRKNQNPLPKDGLLNLCKEGFSDVIYLYQKNAEQSAHKVTCNCIDGSKNELNYVQLDYYDEEHIYTMMQMMHKSIIDSTKGPVYFHCWNGWHASGFIAALALRQFCGMSGIDAVTYWDLATDGANRSAHYKTIRKQIREFEPFEEFVIRDSLGNVSCPPMPKHIDRSKSRLSIDQLVIVPEAIPVGATIILEEIEFKPNELTFDSISFNKDVKQLVSAFENDNELKLEIGGHTDNRGGGDENRQMSEARAKFLYNELISVYGVDRDKLSYKGYGSSRPAYSNKREVGRAANRRLEVEVLAKKNYGSKKLVDESAYGSNYKKWSEAKSIVNKENYVLSNLAFVPSSSSIGNKKNKDLLKLLAYLKENNKVIEVGGHTDPSGIKEKNDTLSIERAEAVKLYLIERGIDKSRIIAKGYGSSKPIADNQQKWGRDINRRIEVLFRETK